MKKMLVIKKHNHPNAISKKWKAPYGAFFILSLLLTSCSKQDLVQINDDRIEQDSSQELRQLRAFHGQNAEFSSKRASKVISTHHLLQEARLMDIPVPLGVEPKPELAGDATVDQLVLGYVTELDMATLVVFYQREMERLGWQQLSYVAGVEQLLVFSKPGKLCAINFRTRHENSWWYAKHRVEFIMFIAQTL